MKITIPENISDITLSQFQRYEALVKTENVNDVDFSNKFLNIFTGLPLDVCGNVVRKDYQEVLNAVVKALDVKCEFTQTFDLFGKPFGMIPNFDNITSNEYTDLIKYQGDTDNLHRLMAILFRPIKNIDKLDNYSIVDYNGTSQYCELMRKLPMNIVNGCLGFFLSLSNDLDFHTLKYILAEQVKEVVL